MVPTVHILGLELSLGIQMFISKFVPHPIVEMLSCQSTKSPANSFGESIGITVASLGNAVQVQ